MTFLLSRHWLQESIVRAFAITLSLFAMALPAVAADTAAPAPAATPASQPSATAGTVFEGVVADPVDLGEPNSPRASLVHYFEAVREGRWDDATRHLVLDAKQHARGADLARRLKAVIDDTGWIDLETVSDSH